MAMYMIVFGAGLILGYCAGKWGIRAVVMSWYDLIKWIVSLFKK